MPFLARILSNIVILCYTLFIYEKTGVSYVKFYEKLDFLMNITKTNNSALSKSIKLDASYISRLRRGTRNALKDKTYINLMAEYFTKRCTDDCRRKALADVLDISFYTMEEGNLSQKLVDWLMTEEKNETKTVGAFLSGLSSFPNRQRIPSSDHTLSAEFPKTDIEIYYGVAGKRQAAAYFLSEVLVQERPQTLLLFSDEPTDWMTADSKFAKKWADLMAQVLAKGNRIKIIHTISRNLDEMLNAISQWMPLYMSGAIEPYYYPKKRDGIFKRTLFIAPDSSAVISSTVGNMADKAANFLIRNKTSINAFAEEFKQYLNLCNPLMRIFTSKDKELYLQNLFEFEKEKGNCIIKTESLSLLTMPEIVIKSIFFRIINTGANIDETHKKRTRWFKQYLQANSLTEIIKVYDVETVKNGEVKVAFSILMNGEATYYTLEEYILHLENIQYLLNTYPNFHVCLIDDIGDNRYMVYAKEDLGAIVAKTSVPPVALGISEANMAAAFWDYLKHIIGEKSYLASDKKESIIQLSDYINRLKQFI